ncbi:MAG: preprotein translocase subunit SecG [Bacilli bacterium]
MEKVLLVVSVILIVVVLLQSNKASDASQIITGGNSVLLGKSKERGFEKFITRLTYILGFAFIVLSMILSV